MSELKNIDNALHAVPLHFKNYEEFEAYVRHPRYEIDINRPGLCLALEVKEDLDSEEAKKNGQSVEVNIYTETRDGKSPSNGGSDPPT